ncbi:DUF2334 domain-containing protein [Haloimpatiens sp. FM7330]|uniref:DUF2334 domain-containing protein n=1 Tax=Haloimpatiens sp. FM7330 TaxID=3298610 RepID=UPI00362C44D5
MMYKKIGFFLIAFSIIFVNFNYKVYGEKIKTAKVLMVYDRENVFGYQDNIVNCIEELLYNFSSKVDKLDIEEYNKGYINKYDYIFVLGIEGKLNKSDFIQDLFNFKGKICWIGKGINYFLNDKKYEVSYFREKTDITELYYTNKRDKKYSYSEMKKFFIGDKWNFTTLNIKQSEKVEVFSYMSDGTNYYPFALKNKNLWYISSIDDNSLLFYVFCDLLNDIFDTKIEDKGNVFIRIEDVHPFRDTNKLKAIADYLYKENIPFIIALIPAYVNKETGYINNMSQNKEFINAIKYMENKGGTVILHGYIHQNRKGTVSGEGFEFWDGYNDAPLNVNIEKLVYDKVEKGLTECVKNKIYPLGFEAPHYAIDEKGYKELKKYFSTYVGQYQSSNKKFTTTAFPYVLRNTKSFNKLIPENLGYIDIDDPLTMNRIKENFEQVSMVRGYTAGLFFHPYLDIKYLKRAVNYLKQNEVRFLDLKQEHNWVMLGNIKIYSDNGNITVEGISNKNKDSVKKINYISKINIMVIIIVSIFCITFLIIFIKLKRIDKNKFLR